MEKILSKSSDYLSITPTKHTRQYMNRIDWSWRLIGIKGSRGVGKSTILRQRIKLYHSKESAVYLSLDDAYFTETSLEHTLENLRARGLNYFVLDEVHKYPGWSRAVKSLHDRYPDIFIAFSGSSIIDLHFNEADLSRRAIMYEMPGLSFREYLALKEIIDYPATPLEDLFLHHSDISRDVTNHIRPLKYFQDYLRSGYYPYFIEGEAGYLIKVEQSIRASLESDLLAIKSYDVSQSRALYKLLYILSGLVPFKPNIALLARRIGLHPNTIVKYLNYLESARLVSFLLAPNKGMSLLQKPDKLFLQNTNLAFALQPQNPNIGSIRETFFNNQVSHVASINYSSKADFLINDKYLIEVGGASKEVRSGKSLFIVKDQIEHGVGQSIPLWLFGFLY